MRRFDALWHFNGTAFSDVSDSLGDATASLTLAAGDKLYMGYRDWLSGVYVNMSTPATSPNIVAEAWDGRTDTWKTLPVKERYSQLELGHQIDPTGYNFDGDGAVYWGASPYLWALKTAATSSFPESVGTVPDSSELYWVRLRNAGANGVTFDRALPLPYNTYVDHEEMASFMGMPEFDDIRAPYQSVIRDRIRSAEDWFDNYTRRSWRIRPYFSEHYDFNPYGFVVKHRPLITVMSMGFWAGTSFQSMNEGRGKDWFATPEKSLIRFTLPSFQLRYYSFLLSRYLRQPDSVQIDYLAGDDFDIADQRGDVRDVIFYKVGADLIRQLDWTVILVNNPDAVPKPEKARQWDELAYKKADELRGLMVI